MEDQHIYHINVGDVPKVTVHVEKNTKGYNWEVTVVNCPSVDVAMTLLKEAEERLRLNFDGG